MNVFIVSDLEIYANGGGSIGDRTRYQIIERWCRENEANLFSFSLDCEIKTSYKHFTLTKTSFYDAFARMLFHSSYVFLNKKTIKKQIKKYKPHVVILCRTRFGFLAKWIKKHFKDIKIIVFESNVEIDYAKAAFLGENCLKQKIESISVRRDEKNAFIYQDCIVYLTNRDRKRFDEVYNKNNLIIKNTIVPVCVENTVNLTLDNKKNNVVFIGSLNYPPNEMAVINFVEKVWLKKFNNDTTYNLIIGGKSPTQRVKNVVQKVSNCEFYSNFSKIEDIIPIKSLIVSYIEHGSGMKLKVAEALCCGLGVVGTKETFEGYEEALAELNDKTLFVSDCVEEYGEYIKKYFKKYTYKNEGLNKCVFNEFYSKESVYSQIKKMLDDILF